jgi:2-methylcitrate dehydratase PrpD
MDLIGQPDDMATIAITDRVVSHVASVQFDDLPCEAVTAMKRSLLDAIGVTLGASGSNAASDAFVTLARECGGAPEAPVIGCGFKAPAMMAAFANGAMAHVLDFEDVHDEAVGHPNAAGVPAALAIAGRRGKVSGKELLTALVLGGDLAVRMSFSIAGDRHRDGWFIGPVLGAYGATAAAGKVLGLNKDQLRDAFSYTLCQATGSSELKYSPQSEVRAVRDAFGAKAAVVAAILAQKGVRGFDLPFEGKAGFYELFMRGRYSAERLLRDLGSIYECASISFKPWPSCRGTHSFIEAALDIALRDNVTSDDIEAIHATGSADFATLIHPADQKLRPSTAIDAKFSLPFTAATAFCHRAVKLRHFLPKARQDEAVLELARRVSYTVDPALGPDQNSFGTLEVQTRSGARFQRRITEPFGHPTNPMTDEALEEKFLDCASHAAVPVTPERARTIIDIVRRLEDVRDIEVLTHHL